jgi:deferrochelatase/peroxidase EfeB
MTSPDLRDLQGNIVAGYGPDYLCVRHVILRVTDPVRARAALAAMLNGDRSTPEVTPAQPSARVVGYNWCLNLGITYHGLQALGVAAGSLKTFPPEFRQGMAARATRLGDVDASAPGQWSGGLSHTERVDLIASIHGRRFADIEPIADQVLAAQAGMAFEQVSTLPFDGQVLEATDDKVAYRRIHFGFRDGISQPRFEGIHSSDRFDRRSFAPFGAVLLGYPTAFPHVRWRVPEPEQLGFNGSFNAFRVLRQDVKAFAEFLDKAGRDHGLPPDLVAAKLCGRWPNGVPLTLAPTEQEARSFDTTGNALNDFGYLQADADGTRCPIGSHIRRTNPRDAHIVQLGANRTRTIVRRGMPYGPPYHPGNADDNIPRGLLGNFICASLSAQFESLQYDWLNLGLQDPRITGTNDPLVGVNHKTTSRFEWPVANDDPIVLHNLPRFVTTQGGAYTFLPSLTAVRWIAGLRAC